MASPEYLDGFLVGQYAKEGALHEWRTFAEGQANQVKQQQALIQELQDKLVYQTAVAEANKKTGRLVLDELKKVAPTSPLVNPDRIKTIGNIFYQEAYDQIASKR